MPFKSLVNVGDYLPCRCVSYDDNRRSLFLSRQKDTVSLHRQNETNVGITTHGGFIIPANDLTKRTRRPGMGRVESRSPLSRGRPSSLSPSLFPERSYSPIYIPRCNLRWPRRAVRASIYAINYSKRPSTAIGDTAIYRASGVQLSLEKKKQEKLMCWRIKFKNYFKTRLYAKKYIEQVFSL